MPPAYWALLGLGPPVPVASGGAPHFQGDLVQLIFLVTFHSDLVAVWSLQYPASLQSPPGAGFTELVVGVG